MKLPKHYMIICLIMLFVLTINIGSTFEFDNTKNIKDKTFDGTNIFENEVLMRYKPVEIKNVFGFGKILFEGYISQHTEFCKINCNSTIEINLHEDGILIDDIIFKAKDNNGNWNEQLIKEYKLYIDNNEYKIGDSVKAGIYTIRLEGKKESNETIDWIIKSNGAWLNEWAIWGSIGNSTLLNNLIAYYDAENSSFEDLSGNGIDGTSQANNVFQEGLIGNGVFTNHAADNGVDVDGIVTTTGIYSISFWAKTNNTDRTNTHYFTVDSYNGSSPHRVAAVLAHQGFHADFDGPDYNFTSDINDINDSVWHHFVMTHNISDVELYLDGASVLNITDAYNDNIQGDVAIATSYSLHSDTGWYGMMDEIGYWEKELTINEVLALYNSGDGITYPFDSNATAEVILNSPEDNFLSLTNNILFNCSANVTGSSSLVNISLWTNSSGTWGIKNSSEIEGSPITTDTLTAYYKLDEATGIVVDSVDSHSGINSGATRNVTGKIDKGFSFDGVNDRVTLNQSLTGAGNFTISFWINTTTASVDEPIVFGSSGNRVLFALNYNGNNAADPGNFKVYSGTHFSCATSEGLTLNNGTWQHVVFVRDITSTGSSLIYVNGKVCASYYGSVGTGDLLATDELMFGADSSLSSWYDGSLDEISVWNKTLNSSEIEILYNSNDGLTYPFGSILTSITQTFNENITNSSLWSCQACDTDGTCGFSLENRTVFIDLNYTAPMVSLIYPIATNYTAIQTKLNFSVNSTNLDTCWYSTNDTINVTTSCLVNVTGLVSNEGENNWSIYANDTYGTENQSSVIFNIDSVAPIVTLVSPVNGTVYNSSWSNIDLNFTSSDTNLDACWFNNMTINYSTACNTNISYLVQDDTNVIIYYANDSFGNIGSSKLSIIGGIFVVDISNSTDNIIILNGTSYWEESANLTFNSSSPSNSWFSWLVDGIEKLAGIGKNVFNYVFNLPSESPNATVNLETYNESGGALLTNESFEIVTNSINPLLEIIYPIETNYLVLITELNYTIIDVNSDSCWISENTAPCFQESASISNQTSIDGDCDLDYSGNYYYDTTSASDCPFNFINYTKPEKSVSANWTVKHGSEAAYNVSIPQTCFDYYPDNILLRVFSQYNYPIDAISYGQCYNGTWNTITETFISYGGGYTLTGSNRDLVYDGNYNTGIMSGNACTSVGFSAYICNGINCTNGTFYEEAMLWDIMINAVPAGTNFTNLTSSQGFNNWTVYCNDTAGNENQSSVAFNVDTITPAITLIYPIAINYTIVPTELNFSVNDANLDTCWYSTNDTINVTTSCLINITNLVSNQGENNWTIYVNDTYGHTNQSSVTFNVDSIMPEIVVQSPNETVLYGYDGSNITLNVTFTDTNLDNCWYNQRNCTYHSGLGIGYTACVPTVNISIPCLSGILTSNQITTFIQNQRQINMLDIYANDTYGTLSTTLINWTYLIFNNGVVYDETVIDTDLVSFLLELELDSSISNLYANLNYLGTTYLSGISESGLFTNASNSINIPIVYEETNNSFDWTLFYTIGTTSYNLTTNSYNQTVSPLNISLCNASSDGLALNFSTYDSSTNLHLNASLEIAINYQVEGASSTVFKTYSYASINESKSNWMFCINENDYNATINAVVSYYVDEYDSREYIISDGIIGNFTQNIPLFLTSTSLSDILTVTVLDQNLNAVSDALVYVEKWDVGTDTYYTMGMFNTNDEGQGFFNVVLYNEWYRFIVVLDGEVVKTTTSEKLSSTSKTIHIQLGGENNYILFDNIQGDVAYNNDTQVVSFTFVDTSGYTQQGCMECIKTNNNGSVDYYDECVTSTAGIISTHLTENGTYTCYGKILLISEYDNIYKIMDVELIQIGLPAAYAINHQYGKFISFLMLGFAAFIGVVAESIFLGLSILIIVLITIGYFGWLNITPFVFWGIVTICIIIVSQMYRRYA